MAALWSLDAVRAAWPGSPAGDPPAVAVCAIDERGRKRYRERWDGDKRSYGPITETSALLALGDPEAEPVHIAEGIADALAIYSRRPGLVLAAITKVHTILNRSGVISRLAGRCAMLWPDHDANQEGQQSGATLAETLQANGITYEQADFGDFGDPAEWSTATPFTNFDLYGFEEAAGRFLDEHPTTEADRLAIHVLTQPKG